MLVDHKFTEQRSANAARRQGRMRKHYGKFIETLLAWCWFMTITFREFESPAWALAQLQQFFHELQSESPEGIGWLIAEDLGSIGGRFHVHVLVAGVDGLPMDTWERRATRRFGLTRVEPFEAGIGGGEYMAKNGLATSGDFHFGGELLRDLSSKQTNAAVGRIVVARSADVPSAFFHMTLGRRRTK